MSVLVDEGTRLCVAGITGREGSFHTLNNRNYGTNVVGGVTPGKGGQDVEGIPVFDSWAEAVAEVQPNTAMIFVPPRFAADAILEAAAAGRRAGDRDHRGHPRARRAARLQHAASATTRARAWSAPTAPASSRRARPTSASSRRRSSSEGNVGVVSRSGTLTYQIGNEIARAGFGCSSIVGIGGDPVPGSSFVDILELFEADDADRADRALGRDRRLGRGGGRRVHRREHVQAGRRLHRGLHRPRRQADGPRRGDRLGLARAPPPRRRRRSKRRACASVAPPPKPRRSPSRCSAAPPSAPERPRPRRRGATARRYAWRSWTRRSQTRWRARAQAARARAACSAGSARAPQRETPARRPRPAAASALATPPAPATRSPLPFAPSPAIATRGAPGARPGDRRARVEARPQRRRFRQARARRHLRPRRPSHAERLPARLRRTAFERRAAGRRPHHVRRTVAERRGAAALPRSARAHRARADPRLRRVARAHNLRGRANPERTSDLLRPRRPVA